MLGDRIKAYRIQKNLASFQLAEMVDISNNYLSEIERSVKFPSLDTFTRIAKALEVPADYLLRDTHTFAVFALNDITERLKNEKTEKLNGMIDVCEVLLGYAKEE
ncbi:MAG: helix-turn-helix domain-containing protein [Oscillospiraceae bacterium]|nr:helix-turn-helix domain-containing protein [Oscillospiraceae bacterium]